MQVQQRCFHCNVTKILLKALENFPNQSNQIELGMLTLKVDCTIITQNHTFKGSVTSNDSGVGFYNDNHNAELAPPLPRHHSRTQRPLPPQGSSRHRKYLQQRPQLAPFYSFFFFLSSPPTFFSSFLTSLEALHQIDGKLFFTYY